MLEFIVMETRSVPVVIVVSSELVGPIRILRTRSAKTRENGLGEFPLSAENPPHEDYETA